MRLASLALPALLAAVPALAADAPIPQDAALAAKRSAERLEWNRKTLVGAYDKVGKKDARWDAKAREALETAARVFSQQVDPPANPEDIQPPAKAAVSAGCDDPMVVYLLRRSKNYQPDLGSFAEPARRMKEAAAALGASKYPAIRRAAALANSADGLSWVGRGGNDEVLLEQARDQYEAALALLPEKAADEDRGPICEERWYGTLIQILRGLRETGLEPLPAYERVDAALAAAPDLEALRLKFRGKFWFDYGWEARSTGFAPAVPQGGFAKLEERLEKAREALEKSWSLRPDPQTAELMIELDKAVGGDRENMEMWFERAMKLDPDHRGACWSKLDWLDPKWHGSWEDLIAFGRACGATKNWRTGITLLAGDAHYRRVGRMEPTAMTAYLSPAAVWSDIGPAYEEYLKHFPKDAGARSKYAMLLYRADRWPESHAQFQILGDDLTTWSEYPFTPLPSLKKMRAQLAQLAVELQKKKAAAGAKP